ncbi:M23 family metallopeptidase [Clostridium thailandense]|uniref:M23 family metallopeptidase n=1 Tax=Clostridium thailandense TaxID=2794346 RepID=A0A949WUX8_9CLOT|nr:M23 family metallopeptidase [Clostridium thailandense]MBV7273067.1 M23 family metallopeptidase [Clostridium thailandense]MCH5135731.1 M23 family metallopeptidase [Clostridiaceae bacterium UIB06]
MGNYNSEYESYYNSLKKNNGARYTPAYNRGFRHSAIERSKGNYWISRITRDLIGVFILFVFVISCKLVVNPKTQEVYNYSKEVLNQNYDYKDLKINYKNIDLKKIQDKITNTIEEIKSKITGNETFDNRIKNEFILPVVGVETSPFGYREDPISKDKKFHAGVDIDAKVDTDVKAAFDGRVKFCGEDKELGKYILIDHGNGIETKYGHLNKILVAKEDAVKKSQIIAKSGNTGKSTGPHLHFELLYMGENKNPDEYFDIARK